MGKHVKVCDFKMSHIFASLGSVDFFHEATNLDVSSTICWAHVALLLR